MGSILLRTRSTRSFWRGESPIGGGRTVVQTPLHARGRGIGRSRGLDTRRIGSNRDHARDRTLPRGSSRGGGGGGIVTSQQTHTYFATFELTATKREDIEKLLRGWTETASRMTRGEPAASWAGGANPIAPDGGAALGLSPARLTLTFGFGPGLFRKDGRDRYGLASLCPQVLSEPAQIQW